MKHMIFIILLLSGCATAKPIISGDSELTIDPGSVVVTTDNRDFSEYSGDELKVELNHYAKDDINMEIIPKGEGNYQLQGSLYQRQFAMEFKAEEKKKVPVLPFVLGIIAGIGLCSGVYYYFCRK